jgi:hypothetical protein
MCIFYEKDTIGFVYPVLNPRLEIIIRVSSRRSSLMLVVCLVLGRMGDETDLESIPHELGQFS